MILKPTTARWFELLTERDHLGGVLRCLASTRAVELQASSAADQPAALPDYRATLNEFGELARRYRAYWPEPNSDPRLPPPETIAGARDALASVRAWAEEAAPAVTRLQQALVERAALAEFAALLEDRASTLPLLELAHAGRYVESRLYALAEAAPPLPPALLAAEFDGPHGPCIAALGAAQDCATLDRELMARQARRVMLPDDLPGAPEAARAELTRRVAALNQTIDRERAALTGLELKHRLAAHLAGFAFLDWLVANVPRLPATDHFAWVTGWTSDTDTRRVERALSDAGLPYLLHFPDAPRGSEPPVVLANPGWLRPFEVFVRLLGVPRSGEADPTVIVALIAPVMFGFMFGDVLQGAVLVLAGLVAWRRAPALRILVPGGLSAVAFGFVFGSVGARDDVLRAWWIHPLDAPLTVLRASVGLGIVVLTAGLLLDALEHAWRGEALRWLLHRAGILVAYLTLLGSVLRPRLAWVAAAGLLWSLLAPLGERGRRFGATLGAAFGESIEALLQLLVNTLSFARIGAFSLAHAGLSAAVLGIAAAAGHGAGYWFALFAGNVLILVLEGLVVSIQTTRLVLFEFFVRFLRADGRPSRPLPPLPVAGHS